MVEVKTLEEINNLIESRNLLLFDFWATWCGSCRMLIPVLESVEQEIKGLTVGCINVDVSPEIASYYEIQSLPTLVLFKNHQEVANNVGFMSANALTDWINDN